MPVFEYKATDASGQQVQGTLLSQSLAAAASDLASRGLEVQHLGLAASSHDPIPESFQRAAPRKEPEGPPPTTQRPAIVTDVLAPLIYQVPLSELLFFFRQLSTMLDAGVPIVSSLETLARQARDPKLRPVIKELLGHVNEGRELSVGMQRYPEVFTPLMLSMVRAGEQGGMLDTALKQMADYIEREIALRNLVRRATLYPKIVVVASILIIGAANYIISEVFGKPDQGIQSPLTSPATWVILAPLVLFLFLFFRIGVRNPRVRHNYSAFLMATPLIGPLVHQMAMAKFSRAFAALYKGGVPMPQALELSADACGSDYLRVKIYPAANKLKEGEGITHSLASTGAFMPQVLDMANTGETTGRIDEMLDKVADFYEGDSEVRANQFAMIFGVICLLAVGIYVAYVVINFWTSHGTTISGQMS